MKAVLVSWQVCFGKMEGGDMPMYGITDVTEGGKLVTSFSQRHSASARQAFCSRAAM